MTDSKEPATRGRSLQRHTGEVSSAIATQEIAAVVLAGGASRRWGGRRKTAALLAGRPVLAHVLAGLPAEIPVIVVGPPEHPGAERQPEHRPEPPDGETAPPPARGNARVRWTWEQPPGGGPVAGLAAGCAALPSGVSVLLVLAGDLPFAGTAVGRLRDALADSDPDQVDAVVAVDPHGRDQPLLAAYRVSPLKAALGPETSAEGRSLHAVLACLRLARAEVSEREAFDLDTPLDLRTAADMLAEKPAPPPPPDLRTGAIDLPVEPGAGPLELDDEQVLRPGARGTA